MSPSLHRLQGPLLSLSSDLLHKGLVPLWTCPRGLGPGGQQRRRSEVRGSGPRSCSAERLPTFTPVNHQQASPGPGPNRSPLLSRMFVEMQRWTRRIDVWGLATWDSPEPRVSELTPESIAQSRPFPRRPPVYGHRFIAARTDPMHLWKLSFLSFTGNHIKVETAIGT